MEGGGDMATQANPRNRDPNTNSKCSGCCSRMTSLFCSNLGVCMLVLLYTAAGAFLFHTIEGGSLSIPMDNPLSEPRQLRPAPTEATTESPEVLKTPAAIRLHPMEPQKLRAATVNRLWTITENLNILYKENWTRVAEHELLVFSDELLQSFKDTQDELAEVVRDKNTHPRNQWTFEGAFLYSLTVISTIGYGSVAPQTAVGKIATIVYALLGIPLMLLYLSSVGDLLSRVLKWIWWRMCRCRRPKREKNRGTGGGGGGGSSGASFPPHMPGGYTSIDSKAGHHLPPSFTSVHYKCGKYGDVIFDDWEVEEGGAVPVALCLIIMIGYIFGGAAIFAYTQGWTFLQAIYFCFSALTTIGFGDVAPATTPNRILGMQVTLIGTAIYLLIGMALIATCFNLMQEQVTSRGGHLSRRLGGIVGHPNNHHKLHLDDT